MSCTTTPVLCTVVPRTNHVHNVVERDTWISEVSKKLARDRCRWRFTDVTGLSDVGLCKVEPCLKIASIWRWAQAKCTTPLCLAMGAAVADVKPLEVPGTRGHLSLRGTEIAKAKLVDCAPP